MRCTVVRETGPDPIAVSSAALASHAARAACGAGGAWRIGSAGQSRTRRRRVDKHTKPWVETDSGLLQSWVTPDLAC